MFQTLFWKKIPFCQFWPKTVQNWPFGWMCATVSFKAGNPWKPGSRCFWTRSTVYTATVEVEGDEYVYHGTAEGEVKKRIGKHETSFRHRRYENDTALSQFIWKLKDRGSEYAIRWTIELRAHPYSCGAKRCDLCLSEKMVIARSRHGGMLNARSELVSKCRHRNKFNLASVT